MVAETKVWFVTGASRGFGREIALEAIARGHRVVATARQTQSLAALGEDPGLLTLALDVTDAASITAAVAAAEQRFGGIDVLVNNAGYGYLAAIEEGDEAEIRALFDANFFGLAAVTRAVLPGLRSRRRGTIVNISSIGGFVGLPGSGYYAASKFAVEGLSEALAREIEPLGLRVLLVEPGPFRTDWAGSSMRQAPGFIADYEPTAGTRRRGVRQMNGRQPGAPDLAARAIVTAVEHPAPPFRLPLGDLAATTLLSELDRVRADVTPWLDVARATDRPLDEELAT